jgi:hypothetical protein
MAKGTDMTASAVKGAGFGLAGGGAKGLITHFAKDKVATMPEGTGKRLVAGALGCACSNSYPALGRPRRALRMPLSLETATSYEPVLDLAV